MGKYEPLYKFLLHRREKSLTLSFQEIELILGDALPPSVIYIEELVAEHTSATMTRQISTLGTCGGMALTEARRGSIMRVTLATILHWPLTAMTCPT